MLRSALFAAGLALAASFATAIDADAQTRLSAAPAIPTLKRSVTVADSVVRVGDLVDNAGAYANVPIFRAPDLGTTGAVSAATVREALRPYHMFTLEIGDITEVEVTRSGQVVPAADIRARILRAFAGQYGLGEAKNLTLLTDRDIRAFAIEPSAIADLVVTRSSYDPRNGRFDVTLDVPGSAAARRLQLRYTGTIQELVETVVVTRAVQRGDVLRASDIAIERRPKGEVPMDAADPAERTAGLAVRQPMRSGQPLRRADLMKPDMVRRDDQVTIIYEAPGIYLTTRGKVLEAGAEGDIVNAVNLTSKRNVQGVVTGPGQITMMTTPRAVAATAMLATSERAGAPAIGE